MIVAIVQARMSSTRLPGKVLKPLAGKPMLERQIERIRRCREVHRIVVATSTKREDDALETLCKAIGVDCFRGSLPDVLDRFYQAARPLSPDYIVRFTGDCPLIDPPVSDETIRFTLENGFDYASNCREPTFPDGLDTEVVRWRVFQEGWEEARLASEREHVTPFFYAHPERYRIGSYKNNVDLSPYRWTVDEPEDYELVRRVYEDLYPKNPTFAMADILQWLDAHPDLAVLNNRFERNEGYRRSLENDSANPFKPTV